MSPNYEFEKCMHGIFKANLKYGFLRNMEGRRDREKKGRRTEGRKKKSKRESEERHAESVASGLASHINMNFLFIHSGTILQLLTFAS